MDAGFNPIDSLVSEIKGNIKFLDSLLSGTAVIFGVFGVIGRVGLLLIMALFLK